MELTRPLNPILSMANLIKHRLRKNMYIMDIIRKILLIIVLKKRMKVCSLPFHFLPPGRPLSGSVTSKHLSPLGPVIKKSCYLASDAKNYEICYESW